MKFTFLIITKFQEEVNVVKVINCNLIEIKGSYIYPF